jgi:polar amino acid transport system substrate-binding protein
MSVEDVTYEERKKQEVFELEKNKALHRIVAGVAHEIKNP